MKLKLAAIVLALSPLFTVASAQAAEASVEWINPDEYRDVRPANESRKRFQERTFKEFEEFFVELAAKLPEGQKLHVKVTNVDLAGNVEFGRTQQIRIVRQIHFPRFEFEYSLLDADKEVVTAGQEDLKDMNFLHHVNTKVNSESLKYEKYMIEKWFNQTFETLIAKS
ncbi:DUF3016 domain-containing protein [Thalassotalea euphylliae]|uniref:DUF3016 domain-containing protein n=1 Tax=Thalassotalea euphylliae TaxID=1655234 RepID=UPI003635C8BB